MNGTSFEYSTRLGEIAYRQLNALPARQQTEVFQFIGKLYQAQLEGDSFSKGMAKVAFTHNSETNEVQYSLNCHLSKAYNLLTEAQKVVDSLSDIYLDDALADTPNEDIKASLTTALSQAQAGQRLPLEDLWQPCDDDPTPDDEAMQQLDELIEATEAAAREEATDVQD